MKILFFYENSSIFDIIDEKLHKNFIKYSIRDINKLKDLKADFLILEMNGDLELLINGIEVLSSIPYMIITKNKIDKKYYSLHLLDIINYDEIKNITQKITNYFNKVRQDEYSIFEITDVMQMISMEKKTIALRITSGNKIGAIAFKKGLPIYAKAIINKKVEFGIKAAFKIISWDNIKFKLVKVIGDIPSNLEIDLPNLLMGAMQYKDEMAQIDKEVTKQDIQLGIKQELTFNCQSISGTFRKITGYMGISIFKNGKELCSDYTSLSYINANNLKTHINKITKLVKIMLNDMGFQNFDSILLATETSSAIIYHDDVDKLDMMLFLEKDANMALSKVIVKKIMLELK